MSDNKKYYYMKIKETFFDSEEMRILESQKNGLTYQIFYLKICLLSLKNEGALMFRDVMPYDLNMLSNITRTSIDTVKTCTEIFQKLGLIEILDNETIYISDLQSLVGKSSTEAERIKKYRDSLKKQEFLLLDTEKESVHSYEDEHTESVHSYEDERTERVHSYGKCTPELRDQSIELRDKSKREREEHESTHPLSPILTDITDLKQFDEAIINAVNELIVSTSTLLKQHYNQEKIDELHLAYSLKKNDIQECISEAILVAKKEKNSAFRKDTFFKNLKVFLVDGIHNSKTSTSLRDTEAKVKQDLDALEKSLDAKEDY